MTERIYLKDEKIIFANAGLRALETINWYGYTKFRCPLCGAQAEARRLGMPNMIRNKATWLYCENCGMYIHGC